MNLIIVASSTVVLAMAATTSHAQQTGSSASFADSISNSSYVGLNAGRSRFDRDGCLFTCDETDAGYKLYGGGMFSRHLGLELGYVDLGSANRNGGTLKAYGVNFALVGRAPLSDMLSVNGRLGGLYSWTRVNTPVVGAQRGHEDGFGWSYGAGLQWDFARQWAARLDADRYRIESVSGRDDVELYTAGVVYKFK